MKKSKKILSVVLAVLMLCSVPVVLTTTASVKVTAKGGANYKSGSKTVKVKIKVK